MGQKKRTEKVYINGDLVSAEEASIPFDDRAVLFGDGIFETVRAYRGRPFRLERHLDRLEDGCRVLRLQPPKPTEEIKNAVISLLEENGLSDEGDAYVRITATGGPSTGPKMLERSGPAGLFIIARPYEGYPEHLYCEGLSLVISGIKRNSSSPLSSLKSSNYLDSLIARQEAIDQGADDAVMLTTAGNLAEATSSNLFMVREGNVLTPDIGCGFLPGVTREAVIELCSKLGITCTPVMAGTDVLLSAEEVFLTGSLMEVMPVRRIARKQIGKKCPGRVTARLVKAYRELVARELDL
jgi:branched-subunit amino acid aminotransferase/4-amino-4-deoxychorismate lyase